MTMKNMKTTMWMVLLFSTIVNADPVGTRFSYQGQLLDNGLAQTGDFTFEFSLYADESGGSSLATMPEMTGVPVNNGLFTVELDFGDAHFDGEAVYLEIKVKTDGAVDFDTLSPRQRVNSIPYATQSAFVEKSSSQWQDLSSGIGYTKDVKIGHLNSTSSSALTVDADSSPVRFKIGGATKMIIRNNGGTSIGVNTAAPKNGLRVSGETTLVDDVEMRGNLNQQVDNHGAIKAGVYMFCGNNPSITHSFNAVNDTAITASVGNDPGRCRINFPFPLDNRYFMAMYRSSFTAIAERKLVTCDQDGGAGSSALTCAVSDLNGTPVNSHINIMVY